MHLRKIILLKRGNHNIVKKTPSQKASNSYMKHLLDLNQFTYEFYRRKIERLQK